MWQFCHKIHQKPAILWQFDTKKCGEVATCGHLATLFCGDLATLFDLGKAENLNVDRFVTNGKLGATAFSAAVLHWVC